MSRTRIFEVLSSLAVAGLLAISTIAQPPHKNTTGRKKDSERGTRQHMYSRLKSESRAYAPHVKSRSHGSVIEGRITGLEDNVITIKTARGARYDLRLDDQTSVFSAGELVSIATMADIVLSASDLRVSDWVEIVTERAGRQELARIITRIASSGAQVAKR